MGLNGQKDSEDMKARSENLPIQKASMESADIMAPLGEKKAMNYAI
jgi:hypothetical protein